MPDIVFRNLTKRYRHVTAVNDLSAQITAGRITAFLGANGSGKTTTMRMLLGLAEPSSGEAFIGGVRYRDLPLPLTVVGAVLDQGFQPNRSARNHLRIVAAQAGVAQARVEEALRQMGLVDAARRRVGGFSLGMRQRLNLAAAIIGRPSTLVLDEPFNGLDPAGIQHMRTFLRGFVAEGGTVLLSSHLLSEVSHTADDAIIIDHGRLVGAGAIATLTRGPSVIEVTSPDAEALEVAICAAGGEVRRAGSVLTVAKLPAEAIGRIALDARALVTEMRSPEDALETAYTALTDRRT